MTNQEVKHRQQLTIRKCRWNLWLSLSLVLTLSLVKLALVNRSATWGRQLEQLEAETQKMRAENDQLELELNRQIGGLEQLQTKAKELGFIDKPQYLYLTAGENVAQKLP
ncbi:MAG: hypothetical protein U1C50_04290 [Patescibacteria group bacterium]|nr:hypothetical protein [Patescibacteria group bacterium]MDP4030980.1 hypothetical protein [Candidatus Beckwithbacteria bacterium]MDZ4229441.1 hypothetical protein [Patescibacteria group bacterium]